MILSIVFIIIFFITLVILVLIHEFGHFLMAKKFGIKVEEFGFGIPPRAWGKKIGETLYSINWLPFGGFVKLQGEDEEGAMNLDAKSIKDSRDFRAKPVSQRIIVVVAGVIMNLFLAWLLFYTVIMSQGFNIVFPVAEAGVYIAALEKDFPAQKAGIKVGDRLVAIDNQNMSKPEDARAFIRSKGENPMILTTEDIAGKSSRKVTVTPKRVESGETLIGARFSPIPFKQYVTPAEKAFSGITYSYDLTRLTFMGLGDLSKDVFSGNFEIASQKVAGPVGLGKAANDILSLGREALLPYIWFVGLISLTLAIFNVLPIPALDGGRLLFLVIEAVTRKKVKEDVERIVHQVGFILLIALAILITFSDIRKLLP